MERDFDVWIYIVVGGICAHVFCQLYDHLCYAAATVRL